MNISSLIIVILSMFFTYHTGNTSHYAKDVMQWQVDYHNLVLPCEGCAIAVEDCSEIGNHWWIRPLGSSEEWTEVVVADCAGRDAYDKNGVSWMTKNNVICELSYLLAQKYDAIGTSIKIEVLKER